LAVQAAERVFSTEITAFEQATLTVRTTAAGQFLDSDTIIETAAEKRVRRATRIRRARLMQRFASSNRTGKRKDVYQNARPTVTRRARCRTVVDHHTTRRSAATGW
jgi:hypothetical protein